MLRCAITDGTYLTGDARRLAADGIDYIQLRDRTLQARELIDLGRSILKDIAETGTPHIKLLLNGRTDVAAAIGADGVHLTAHPGELTPAQVRRVFAHAEGEPPIVSVSCHNPEEIRRANANGADLILFGPVFEKRIAGKLVSPGVGLDALRAACELAQTVPVLALGGVTPENTASCLAAGAAGVAGIRLFS